MSYNLNKKDIEDFLTQLDGYENFIGRTTTGLSSLIIEIADTSIVLYREDIGTSYYYWLNPIEKKEHIPLIRQFMGIAIPFLSKELEKNREDDLMTSNCVKTIK